ncbi:hypothetical protein V6N13_029944 [Hibiscus sabdariffa]
MNKLELADMVFILGYRCPVKLYWKKAEDNLTRESIRQLNTDQDVLGLVDNMPRDHYLNVSNESDFVFVESDNDVGEEETGIENVANEVDKEYCGIGLSVLGIGSRVGSDSESQNSESLNSVHESDFDGQKFPKFISSTDMIKLRFETSLVFVGKKIMKEAISQYGRINKYNVKFKKNDKIRLVAACKPGCPWILRASPMNPSDPLDTSWQIKTYVPQHRCARDLKNKHARFLDILKDDVDIVNSYHISFMSYRQKVRTTRKQVPSGQPPTKQSQTSTQPPKTTLVKQPYQPRQKQPIKRKELVVHHDSRKKKQANRRHTNPRWMPSNTQDSTATTQDTPGSNVTNTRVD